MQIPFVKAHGAKNDFLLTSAGDVPASVPHADMARAMCDRHTGIGADGWLHVGPGGQDADAAIQLYNSDGSLAEISGNGTRCAACYLIYRGIIASDLVRIRTGAGIKELRLLNRSGLRFTFEMNMGAPEIQQQRFELPLAAGARDVTLDPCKPEPITEIAETSVIVGGASADSPRPRWERAYELGMGLVG